MILIKEIVLSCVLLLVAAGCAKTVQPEEPASSTLGTLSRREPAEPQEQADSRLSVFLEEFVNYILISLRQEYHYVKRVDYAALAQQQIQKLEPQLLAALSRTGQSYLEADIYSLGPIVTKEVKEAFFRVAQHEIEAEQQRWQAHIEQHILQTIQWLQQEYPYVSSVDYEQLKQRKVQELQNYMMEEQLILKEGSFAEFEETIRGTVLASFMQVAAEEIRIQAINAKRWPQLMKDAVITQQVAIGMTKEQVEASWGKPDRQSFHKGRYGVMEYWYYDRGFNRSQSIHFYNDKVKSLHTRK